MRTALRLLALPALFLALPTLAQSSGGEANDLRCELTVGRYRPSVVVWPTLKDVPAGASIIVSLTKAGGGGVVEDRRVQALWTRNTRLAFNEYAGVYDDCRADATWTNPPAAAARPRPVAGALVKEAVVPTSKVLPKPRPRALPR